LRFYLINPSPEFFSEEYGPMVRFLEMLIFKKGDVTRGVHGKKKARVYYLSYCIVLTYSD
jgi:hypothetical protein